MVPSRKKRQRNITRPRFFERLTPNQLWQWDIFTFRLGGRYAYLIGFIDDYSRYMVGLELYRTQTADQDKAVKLAMEMIPGEDWKEPVRGCGYEIAETVHCMNETR